jgi:hypothetical protein
LCFIEVPSPPWAKIRRAGGAPPGTACGLP